MIQPQPRLLPSHASSLHRVGKGGGGEGEGKESVSDTRVAQDCDLAFLSPRSAAPESQAQCLAHTPLSVD